MGAEVALPWYYLGWTGALLRRNCIICCACQPFLRMRCIGQLAGRS